jgi:hypothetical protein
MAWNNKQIVPNPDPSALTVDKIAHDTTALASTMQSRIDGLEAKIETKIAAMDKAFDLFDGNLNRIPTSVDRQVLQLRELHDARFLALEKLMALDDKLNDEKFAGIKQQVTEHDVRYSLVSSDAKNAVADALSAQQKSVADAFAAQQKAVDKQDLATQLLTNSQTTQLNDLKDRMTRAETASANAIAAQSTKVTSISQIVSYVIAVAAVAAIVLDHLPNAVK